MTFHIQRVGLACDHTRHKKTTKGKSRTVHNYLISSPVYSENGSFSTETSLPTRTTENDDDLESVYSNDEFLIYPEIENVEIRETGHLNPDREDRVRLNIEQDPLMEIGVALQRRDRFSYVPGIIHTINEFLLEAPPSEESRDTVD